MIEFGYKKAQNKLTLKCSASDLFCKIREHFSVENKNSTFIQNKFRGRYIKVSPRKYAITPTGICELGLYWDIRRYLIQNQIVEEVTIADELKSRLNVGLNADLFTDFKLDLRDYQTEVLQKALKSGWGTIILGTGAGKTFTTAALIENYFLNSKNKNTFKCIVIVPDLGLVSQTFDEFLSCGVTFKVTKWTGNNKPDLTSNVIICNNQILISQIKENEWVNHVDLLIVDECHKIKPDNKISKIISLIKCVNRYGFTGTLPQDDFEKWYIIGKLGPLLYEKGSFDLRLEKYLTNVEVLVLKLEYSQKHIPSITGNQYRDELEYIYTSVERNNLLIKICNKLSNNTLILVNHIKHGEELFEKLSVECPDKKVYFIRGDVEVEERDRIKTIIENNSNIICIAISAIFSTGVNIKNLHNIVFAAGGKSFIRTVQSIGRGLRLHPSKTKLIIFDISDSFKYGLKHSDERKKIYKKEKIQFTEKTIYLKGIKSN